MAFVAPALIALGLVLAYPVLFSIWLSFTNASMGSGTFVTPFVGLDNYTALLSDKVTRLAFLNTIYFTVVEVVAVVLLGAWVLSGWQPVSAALVQTGLLVGLNTSGIYFSRDRIPDPAGMVVKNAAFLVLAWVTAGMTVAAAAR